MVFSQIYRSKSKEGIIFLFSFPCFIQFFPFFLGGGDYFLRRGKGEKDKDTG